MSDETKKTDGVAKSAVTKEAVTKEAPKGRELAPHEVRVVDEKKELDDKLTKLLEFRGGKVHDALSPEDRALLAKQFHVMTAYSLVLGKRILRFL